MTRERRRENNRKSISEKRNILKNADISIRNNSLARIVLKSRLSGGSLYVLENNGDIEDIPFNELNDIFKKCRGMFENFEILIEDVYCPGNDDITVEDVPIVNPKTIQQQQSTYLNKKRKNKSQKDNHNNKL